MDKPISFWKRLWEGWKRIAAKIAHVQGHLLLSLIYFGVVTPLALLFKIFGSDPLLIKPGSTASGFWVLRKPITSITDFLNKQF